MSSPAKSLPSTTRRGGPSIAEQFAGDAAFFDEAYDIDRKRFGRHLRSLRTARGLTQEGLAERADLSADTVRRLEAGAFSPSMVTMVKVSKGLRLRFSTIMTSFEAWRLPVEQELADLLVGRDEGQLRLVLEMVRTLLEFRWPAQEPG